MYPTKANIAIRPCCGRDKTAKGLEYGFLDTTIAILAEQYIAYLDFGLTEEANCALVTPVVEVGLSEVHRVVELDDRVGLFGEGFQVGLGGTKGLGCGLLGRGKGGNGGNRSGKEGGDLHLCLTA